MSPIGRPKSHMVGNKVPGSTEVDKGDRFFKVVLVASGVFIVGVVRAPGRFGLRRVTMAAGSSEAVVAGGHCGELDHHRSRRWGDGGTTEDAGVPASHHDHTPRAVSYPALDPPHHDDQGRPRPRQPPGPRRRRRPAPPRPRPAPPQLAPPPAPRRPPLRHGRRPRLPHPPSTTTLIPGRARWHRVGGESGSSCCSR